MNKALIFSIALRAVIYAAVEMALYYFFNFTLTGTMFSFAVNMAEGLFWAMAYSLGLSALMLLAVLVFWDAPKFDFAKALLSEVRRKKPKQPAAADIPADAEPATA